MQIIYKEATTLPEFIDAVRLRYDVFVRELGMQPGWEPDEEDKVARHFIAYDSHGIVGTGRVREVSEGEFKIERMVTRKDTRGAGVGRGILEIILAATNQSTTSRIWLCSQLRVKGFYERNGFVPCGEPFELFGVQHVTMEYRR